MKSYIKPYIKPYKPIYKFPLIYCRVYSKYLYNIENNINNNIDSDINIITNLINNNKMPDNNIILKYAINGNKYGVERLLELKNQENKEIFKLSVELFNGACSSGNIELIKYLQDKGCIEDEYSILEIIGNGYSEDIIEWGLKNLKYTKNNDLDILASAIGTGNLDIIKYLMNYDIRANKSREKSVHDIRIEDLEPVLAACELPYVLFKPIILYLSQYRFKCDTSVFFNIKNDKEYNKKKNLLIKKFDIYTWS
tara:strand:- start:1497 stop:2255 length:759 start_codon:yes stop_codon:yes gene_type:complete